MRRCVNRTSDGKAPPKTDAPSHLQTRGREWFCMVASAFNFEPHDLALVQAAAEQLDRAEAARVQIAAEGQTTIDRFRQVKPHPAVEQEKQALLAFVRLRRELGLDVEPPADSRPPLRRGYR